MLLMLASTILVSVKRCVVSDVVHTGVGGVGSRRTHGARRFVFDVADAGLEGVKNCWCWRGEVLVLMMVAAVGVLLLQPNIKTYLACFFEGDDSTIRHKKGRGRRQGERPLSLSRGHQL